MPKSRKRKKKSKRESSKKAPLRFSKLPTMSAEDQKAFKAAALEHASRQRLVFEKAAESIEKIFKGVSPVLILSLAANYGLTGLLQNDGEVSVGPFQREGFSQNHLELGQALMLRISTDELGSKPYVVDDLPTLVERLLEMARAFAIQRVASLGDTATSEERALRNLQEKLRLHTQFVRNWGNFSQVVEFSKSLYSGLDSDFLKFWGVPATKIIDLFHFMVRETERRSFDRLEMLSKVLRPEFDRDRTITEYFSQNPQLRGSDDELISTLPENANRERVLSFIMSHSDLQVPYFYIFSASQLASQMEVSEVELTRVLDCISLEPGELSEHQLEHILLDNPVWEKPLIRIGAGKYFAPMPQAFFSHIHRILKLLSRRAELQNQLEKQRSHFLETHLAKTLSRAFPSGSILRSVKWNLAKVQYETDAIVFIDRTIMIIEAKSGTITDPALRGAPDRAKRHIQELVHDPSDQSERLKNLFELAKAGDEDAQAALTEAKLWPRKFNRIVRLSVTLEDLSVISSSEKELKSAGWVELNHQLAIAMTAADFETVCQILNSEAAIIHYLEERSRLQKNIDVMADELDWLGLYVDCSFAFSATEKAGIGGLILTGLSKPIDDYLNARDHGIDTSKPIVRQSRLWNTIIRRIYQKKPPDWISAYIALVKCASPVEQNKIQRNFGKILRQIKRNWNKPDRKTAILITPIYDGAIGVVLFGHPSLNVEQQRSEAQNFANQCFADPSITRCLALGFNEKSSFGDFDSLFWIDRQQP